MFDVKIPARIAELSGNLSFVMQDLTNGETLMHRPDAPHIAASVIKLGVMLRAFEAFESGEMNPNAVYTIKPQDKLPSCGAISYLRDGLELTYLDITTLMIILSDNSATNIMIDALGIESINQTLRAYGLNDFVLRRKMFDSEASARGLQNTITAGDCAKFLELLYAEKLVSANASRKMLEILLNQRLNGKIPFYLHEHGIKIAHKTGEDDGVSHDVGIIFAKRPIIAVFLGNDTDVPAFERAMQDMARDAVKTYQYL